MPFHCFPCHGQAFPLSPLAQPHPPPHQATGARREPNGRGGDYGKCSRVELWDEGWPASVCCWKWGNFPLASMFQVLEDKHMKELDKCGTMHYMMMMTFKQMALVESENVEHAKECVALVQMSLSTCPGRPFSAALQAKRSPSRKY